MAHIFSSLKRDFIHFLGFVKHRLIDRGRMNIMEILVAKFPMEEYKIG